MTKLTLTLLVVFFSSIAYSQQSILIFKKGNKAIQRFWEGGIIAFQTEDREWQKGEITRIRKDSFYIRPYMVRYNMMGTDTIRFAVLGFTPSNVFAMPKKGILVTYINGRFQISRAGGHVHFYWVKSGWIFRAGGAGYAALAVTNGIINNDLSFKDGQLWIATGVFAFGTLLKFTYKPVLRLRKRYHLETFEVKGE